MVKLVVEDGLDEILNEFITKLLGFSKFFVIISISNSMI